MSTCKKYFPFAPVVHLVIFFDIHVKWFVFLDAIASLAIHYDVSHSLSHSLTDLKFLPLLPIRSIRFGKGGSRWVYYGHGRSILVKASP